jgi:hypothetical protein
MLTHWMHKEVVMKIQFPDNDPQVIVQKLQEETLLPSE